MSERVLWFAIEVYLNSLFTFHSLHITLLLIRFRLPASKLETPNTFFSFYFISAMGFSKGKRPSRHKNQLFWLEISLEIIFLLDGSDVKWDNVRKNASFIPSVFARIETPKSFGIVFWIKQKIKSIISILWWKGNKPKPRILFWMIQ